MPKKTQSFIFGIIFSVLLFTNVSFAGWNSIDSPDFITKTENKTIEKLGDHGQWVTSAYAIGFSLYKEDYEGLWYLAQTAALSLATMSATKVIINRKRPNGGVHSFPSGHTTAAFIPVSYMQIRYGFVEALPVYLIGSFVAYSRVANRKHYITDVIAGFAISYFWGRVLTKPYKNLQVQPMIDTKSAAIRFTYRV